MFPSPLACVFIYVLRLCARAVFFVLHRESDDHLRDSLSTKRLAALERLALETSERIEDRGNQQENGRDNQASCHGPDADPLNGTHDKIYGGAHVVGAEFADEGIEFSRGRADA